MTLIIEPIHIIYLVVLLAAALSALFGIGKWLLAGFQKHIDERINLIAADSAAWRTVERDLFALRAELPDRYVRREDYIRNQSIIEAKLDALAAKLEVMQLQHRGTHEQR